MAEGKKGRMTRSIITALTGQPEPPCTVFQCQHAMECAECRKACMSFYRYVTSASGRFPAGYSFREPTDFYYLKIFEGEE
jgi:hypothetical protein